MRKENEVNKANTHTRGAEDTFSREKPGNKNLGESRGHRHCGKNRKG